MDFIVRPARPEDTRAACEVRIASWRETYPGMVPQHVLDEMDLERDVARISAPPPGQHRFIAELDGKVVGVGVCGPIRKGEVPNGEIYVIYLLKEAQGKGFGRRMIQRMVEQLVADGMKTLTICTFKANTSSRGFYEHLGGALYGEKFFEIGDERVEEVVYFWRDIRKL